MTDRYTIRLNAVAALSIQVMLLAACGGISFDTRVAERQATRLAMIDSFQPGDTTERQFITRWGNPLQKVRDGARVEYVYRSRTGSQENWVIATFEYGVAIAIRSNDTETCRASFAPRLPGYAGDTPDIVKPVGWCADPADPYDQHGLWHRLRDQGDKISDKLAASSTPPGVAPDRYIPATGQAK